jgi:uncharacterized protein (DUF362 family)
VLRAAITAGTIVCFCLPVRASAQTPAPSPDSAQPSQSSQDPVPLENGGPESQSAPAAPVPTPLPERSLVVEVQDRDAIRDYKAFAHPVRRMVDELITSVTNTASPGQAWSSLVKPSDVVGLKVSTSGAPLFSTHPEVVQAIVSGLEEAGVPARNIIVFDRNPDLLREAGFTSRTGAYRVDWSERNYDPQSYVTSAVAGRLIFGDLMFVGKPIPDFKAEISADPKAKKKRVPDNLSNVSYISRVLTREVTKVINLPIMADHMNCGLAGALYNMTVPNVDNWRRLVDEQTRGEPIPEMYADPLISGKVVMTIMDGLVALYAGGPVGDPNYAVHFGTLYASKDPVAIDALALRQIDRWRLEAKLNPASKDAKYVETSAEYQIGNASPNKIELRQLPLQLRTEQR